MTARQMHLAALAPLVKSGLVLREDALKADAKWLRVGYDKVGTVRNGRYIQEVVEAPRKQETPKPLVVKDKKRVKVEPFIDETPELFGGVEPARLAETVKKWIPGLDDIF